MNRLISVNSAGLRESLVALFNRNRALDFITKRFRLSKRFVFPLLFVTLAKIGSAAFLFYFLNLGISYTFWMNRWKWADQSVRWPFLFLGWDSEWYLRIAHVGYFERFVYAFFPGYPVSIFMLNLVVNNILLSAAMCSFLFGVAWIPLFQAVTERYLSPSIALKCTLVTAFFPYVFIFTTVAYSEALFLFASVASWYFYLKNKLFHASLLAAVAAATRWAGILLALPMFLDILHKREWKHLPYTFISLAALFGWFYYCYISIGDWLAPITAQRYWNWTSWISEAILDQNIVGAILIVLTSILVYYTRKVDYRLTIYSLSYFSVILFASSGSTARFLPFIFPLWITLFKQIFKWADELARNSRWKNKLTETSRWADALTTALCVLFFFTALLLWNKFLMGEWMENWF